MEALPELRINASARIHREQILKHAYCIVVDDFLQDPEALVDFAAQNPGEFSRPSSAYPGVQLPIDKSTMAEVFRYLRSNMSKLYPFLRGGMELKTYLSMVTLQPEELSLLQRVCHIDPNPDPRRAKYAALVYLFNDERLGGTSFYRFRNQDLIFEAADRMRLDADQGAEFLRQTFKTFRETPQYMTDSSEIAERLHTIEPRFNRMVFYPGDIPHSGAITAPELLSEDFRTGRLTLNLFASAWPKPDRAQRFVAERRPNIA